MSTELTKNFQAIIEHTNEDITRDGLKDTPSRAAKAFDYLTSGYNKQLEDVVNGAIFESHISEMVVVKDIELYSLCEHHMLPFLGKCHIGYIPNGKVLGLSKFARIADMFSRRLQIQENLTQQIADAVMQVTNAKGVGVVISAQHMCMMMRGASKQNAFMDTSVMLGIMKTNPSSRQEFLHFIK